MNLTAQFHSLETLWYMNGHGPYVWAAYGITAAAFVFLASHSMLRRRQIRSQIRATERRERALQSEQGI